MSEQDEQLNILPNKDDLIAQIQSARRTFWALVDGLSDDTLVAKHDAQGWTIKDHLVHLALWQDGIAAVLCRQPRWDAMGLTLEEVRRSQDNDAINALLQARYAALPVAQARAMLHESEARLDSALAPLATADLLNSYASYQPDEPEKTTFVAAYIVGNTCGHYQEHLPWIEALVART